MSLMEYCIEPYMDKVRERRDKPSTSWVMRMREHTLELSLYVGSNKLITLILELS